MKHSAVAIGTFDGFHKGHSFLVQKLVSIAKIHKLRSVIVALSAPVRRGTALLTPLDEKVALLKQLPVDEVVILHTGPEITSMTARSFFEGFLIGSFKAAHIVVGTNFAFGHNREGDTKWLKKACKGSGIKVDAVEPLKAGGQAVSSSRIRALLHESRLTSANKLLGRAYSVSGLPVRGNRIGRKLGFPTVNLATPPCKLLPLGVFAGIASAKGRHYAAVANIGTRPTFFGKGGSGALVEINLLGFTGRWPVTQTKLYLLRHLRAEKRFSNVKALAEQIRKDLDKARVYLRETEA
ncbi:MAG: riboflavin biosynthesis protein RibF [Elusimicrobiota bacterium]